MALVGWYEALEFVQARYIRQFSVVCLKREPKVCLVRVMLLVKVLCTPAYSLLVQTGDFGLLLGRLSYTGLGLRARVGLSTQAIRHQYNYIDLVIQN